MSRFRWLLVATVVAGTAIVAVRWLGDADTRLADDISAEARAARSNGTDFALSDAVENRQWQEVFVFRPRLPKIAIVAGLGFEWARAPAESAPIGQQLLVFARGDRVIFHMRLSTCDLDLTHDTEALSHGVSRSDAVFAIEDVGDDCLRGTLRE